MPILPPIVTAPYDTVGTALNLARIRANDAIASLGGDLLTNDFWVTLPLTNAAWRKLQIYLDYLGYSRFKSERYIYNISKCLSQDPSNVPYISWVQYFDGANYFKNVVLPGDLMYPLECWERCSASAPSGQFYLMQNAVDGFRLIPNTFGNQVWQWRSDAIYLGGTNQNFDLMVKGSYFLADFPASLSAPGNIDPTAVVPIRYGTEPLSYFICAELALGRDDMDAQQYITFGQDAARMILNRDVRANQRTTVSRKPYGVRRRIGGGAWL